MMQRGLLLFFLSGILLICSGCSNFIGFTKEQTAPSTCANLVIERAFKLHEDAKSGLALFLMKEVTINFTRHFMQHQTQCMNPGRSKIVGTEEFHIIMQCKIYRK